MTDEAQRRAHEFKAAFLRRMAHEMRTPLASMLMLAELLADNAGGRLGEREVGYAEKLLQAGGEIRDLIEEVLDLSRLETGAVEVDTSEVALATMLEEVAAEFDDLAGDAPIELAAAVDAELPSTLRTDRVQLRRLLRLILAHAARATAEGIVRLRAHQGSEAMIELVVSDDGEGLTEEERREAFEPFAPGQRGLRLPIARRLAELLGGTLAWDGEELRGNTLVLRLPSATTAS